MEFWARAALAAAAVLLTLATAEGILRGLRYEPQGFNAMARLARRDQSLVLDCYPSNPRGYFAIDLRDPASRSRYFALAPHRYDSVARRCPFAVESRYNSARFRGGEYGAKRAGVTRVVVFGDSFTEGLGVKEEDAYPRVLEALLNVAEPGRFEVLNCGRRHTDFPELLDLFEESLALDPDIVVYGMSLNDPFQSPRLLAEATRVDDWIVERRRAADEASPDLSGSRLLAFMKDRFDSHRIAQDASRWYRDLYGEGNHEGWQHTVESLSRMNVEARRRGSRFLLVSWPLLVDLEGTYPFEEVSETIRRACLRSGITHHDLLQALRGRRSASLWVHPVDMHPNEVAHRLAAESLVPVIRSLN